MTEIIFLEVPFGEKDEAKKLGARWNPERKQWYVPADADKAAFEKWLPSPISEAIAPIYLIESAERCYKCNKVVPVATLAAAAFHDAEDSKPLKDFVVLNHITHLPTHIIELLKPRFPRYFMDYSGSTQSCYMMNHCTCGAKLGNFFMHNEPGGAFTPSSLDECKGITMTPLPENKNMPVRCCYSYAPSNPLKKLQSKKWLP